MLFSIYASYRWARSKHYLIKMAVFIVLAWLLPAIVAWPGLVAVFFGPASVLSFPFYSASSLGGGNPLLEFYHVHFLIWVIYPYPFILFMLVNIAGAALGYLINKAHIFPESYSWRGLLLLIALGVITIGVGVWLYNLSPSWSELRREYIYPYRDYDAWRFWTYGFTWIAMVVGDFIYMATKKVSQK